MSAELLAQVYSEKQLAIVSRSPLWSNVSFWVANGLDNALLLWA